ncbi:stage VI sporulation protein F [Alteribacter keqinensis]|uniref:Stage VI sporulation protein F n=1 Tax=Alteribacter keqinensis TaxID=2483800 RepID=A0A3M7TPR7_9BACI|nr:stage VI sporulation protein F [Alteribacter keqinensis]RNA66669.1 stage VI sporulation protein F [Alteribacter keqinensis]
MFNKFFGGFEKKTGVGMNEVLKLAQSVQSANLKDEKVVRDLIQRIAKVANRKVTKEKEDQLVKAIMSGNVPKDIGAIQKMMKDKK